MLLKVFMVDLYTMKKRKEYEAMKRGYFKTPYILRQDDRTGLIRKYPTTPNCDRVIVL